MAFDNREIELLVLGMMLAKPDSSTKVNKRWFVNSRNRCIAEDIQARRPQEVMAGELQQSGCEVAAHTIAECVKSLLRRMELNAVQWNLAGLAQEYLGGSVGEQMDAPDDAKERFIEAARKLLDESASPNGGK